MPSAYDFQRRVIEQAESRAAIQSIVVRLTGVDAVISVKTVTDPQQSPPQSEVVPVDQSIGEGEQDSASSDAATEAGQQAPRACSAGTAEDAGRRGS